MPLAPGTEQLDALRKLRSDRGLLLQYQMQWRSGDAAESMKGMLFSTLTDIGAEVLSMASVDLLTVGQSDKAWNEIWLIEFPGPDEVMRHINSNEFKEVTADMADIEVIVASVPPRAVRRVLKLLNLLLPLLPASRAGRGMPEEELQGGINPTAKQFEAFQAADQANPIHMFNLLKFHERAKYQNGDRGKTGRQAYENGYGKVAMECFLRLGGRIVMFGRYRFTLIGRKGDTAASAWDEIAVVQYPNRPAFTRMLSTPRYIRALEHRHAGLALTRLWSATPLKAYCK